MKHSFDLKTKKILLHMILILPGAIYSFFYIFLATKEDKLQILESQLDFSIRHYLPPTFNYLIGLYTFLLELYFLELVIYKRKNILTFEKNKITYFAPEYGKLEIPKDEIKDTIIQNNKYLKIILKNNKKLSIRGKIWTYFKSYVHGLNHKNIYRINLEYIKCDPKYIQYLLIQYEYVKLSNSANQIINKILKENNYSSIKELKTNKERFNKCIIDLYNLDDFSQKEIASILQTNTTKVSKTISKYLNKK